MSQTHYLPLSGFTVPIIRDTLLASRQYVVSVAASDVSSSRPAVYPTLVWNYMPPSAGSIIHPHMQIFVEEEPLPLVRQAIKLSGRYYKVSGGEGASAKKIPRNFYQDLWQTEKHYGKRYIGATKGDTVVALAPFAPRGFSEVHLIVPNVRSIGELSDAAIDALSEAMVKLLKGYEAMDVGSFNMASFSGAVRPKEAKKNKETSTEDNKQMDEEEEEGFWLHFKFFSRPKPENIYTNDTGPTERMYDVWVINTIPEETAATLKEVWEKPEVAQPVAIPTNPEKKPQ